MESGDKTEKILERIKGKRVGVFCDGANLFHASKENRWQVDLDDIKDRIILE